MYEYLTPFISAIITMLGLILFAFMRRKKCALGVQLTFLYFAAYYFFFLLTLLVRSTQIDAVAMALGFCEGPLIYWVVLTFTVGERKQLSYFHWLPAALAFCIYMIDPIVVQDPLYVLVSVSRILYGIACCILLWGAYPEARDATWRNWVPLLVVYTLALAAIKLAAFTIYHMDKSWQAPDWVLFLKTTGAASVVLLLLWWALIRSEIFTETREQPCQLTKKPSAFEIDVFERLTKLFEREEIFQEADLNLAVVADKLAVSSRELSEAVNKVSGVGFRALLRQYRIKKACEIFTSQEGANITVLEVAMRSGFATKSVFNAAFRSETGFTPSAYRKSAV